MEIKGRIVRILPLVSGVSASGEWKKQEFILETAEQYPKKVCISIWGAEKITQFNIKENTDIVAGIDVSSREYNGRWYTEVRAWKVSLEEDQIVAPQQQYGAQMPSYVTTQPMTTASSNIDDLPF